MNKVRAAVIGTGNIGTDLLIKIMRSKVLECSVFIGRNPDSAGIHKARSLGVPTSTESINYFSKHPNCCDIVFDATSAHMHKEHAKVFAQLNLMAIDLTPAKVGKMSVFSVNAKDCLEQNNLNMVTCGGQASIPIAHTISQVHSEIDYLEVISSISSNSAGPATRLNLDEYIYATEQGLQEFSKAKRTKAILNLNPAKPCIDMQTTIFAKVSHPQIDLLSVKLNAMIKSIQQYVPGYELILGPILENGRIVVMVKVRGLGDYLPKYAGNLDIINCSAIAMAELWAQHKLDQDQLLSYV